jgi:hypothetical protein
MINQDGFCSNCKIYQYPDRRYADGCGRPFVPPTRETRLTPEEHAAHRRREIDLRHAAEKWARQDAEEQREREWGKTNALMQEQLGQARADERATLDAGYAKVKTLMAAVREYWARQAKAERLDRRLGEGGR